MCRDKYMMKFIMVQSFVMLAVMRCGLTTPEQVHLSLGTTVQEMFVSWNTPNMTTDVYVQYGRSSHLNITRKGTTKKFGGQLQNVQYIHRAIMTNLTPDSTYHYRVGSEDTGWSRVYSIRTLKDGHNWSPNILLYGDLGLENSVAVPMIQQEVIAGNEDFIFHLGDIGYDMYEEGGENGNRFMRKMEPIAARIPYMTCVGNHEWHYNFTNYKSRFYMPGGDGEGFFYSFNVGPVHFIAISTEFYYYVFYGLTQLAKQYEWLEKDLQEANKPENRILRPWIVTFGHRPMYCSNSRSADCFQYESIIRNGIPFLRWYGLETLYYKYGVDLAFWAHHHSYERLWPIYDRKVKNGSVDEPYVNPGATVHIITGSAGNRERLDPFQLPRPTWSAVRINDYGYTKLKVLNNTHLTIQQISAEKMGQVVDRMTLVKTTHGPFR